MDAQEQKNLRIKILWLVPALFLSLGLIFFVPAGTLDYWEAWVYCAVLLIPFLFVLAYLLRTDPELLTRRLRYSEKESAQKRVIRVSGLIFLIGFLIPGLDHRYGWSDIPLVYVMAADVLVILGYALVFSVLKENPFASRVVEVEPGQKIISTGPYAWIRHPMYTAFWLWAVAQALLLPNFVAGFSGIVGFGTLAPAIVLPRNSSYSVTCPPIFMFQIWDLMVAATLLPGAFRSMSGFEGR